MGRKKIPPGLKMFHEIKGKNIKLDGSRMTANWIPSHTGGHAFTLWPLRGEKELILKLDGTGGIELGVICVDPAEISGDFSVYRNDPDVYQFLNDVKIHKRSCLMNVLIDYDKQEVTSTYGRGIYTQKLRGGRTYWLAADIKYGLVEMKIVPKEGDETNYSFSTNSGKNIEVLNDPTIARSKAKSPASLCIYRTPLTPGLNLELHSNPRSHQGTIPGRFYLKLFLTELNPQELQRVHPDKFDVSCYETDNPNWTCIETFEKENCHGIISLEVYNDELKYNSAYGKKGSQRYNFTTINNVWLVVELYGVSVKMKEVDSNVSRINEGVDEIDASRLAPRPIHQINSFVSVESNVPATLVPIPESNEPGNQSQNIMVGASSRIDRDDKIHLEKGIRKNFTGLLKSFVCKQVADILYEREYITANENESIHSSTSDGVRLTLMIMTKRPISRQLLEYCLKETAQEFLLPKFLNEEEKQ